MGGAVYRRGVMARFPYRGRPTPVASNHPAIDLVSDERRILIDTVIRSVRDLTSVWLRPRRSFAGRLIELSTLRRRGHEHGGGVTTATPPPSSCFT